MRPSAPKSTRNRTIGALTYTANILLVYSANFLHKTALIEEFPKIALSK